MTVPDSVVVKEAECRPWDIALHTAFGIASARHHAAHNVLVRLRLEDGTEGYGEAAPLTAVSGETQHSTLAALNEPLTELVGTTVTDWTTSASNLRDGLARAPAALCALETALLDAFCRHQGLSTWSYFGALESSLESDITISTGTIDASRTQAARAAEQGFSVLKVKVGGVPLTDDVERVRAIADVAPRERLLFDGNEAFSAEQAIALCRAVGSLGSRLVAFEQPTAARDVEGLLRVEGETGIVVIADESARSVADVERVAAFGVRAVNIKIMKSGVVEAVDMIRAAKRLGLSLMIGGMVESDLAMSLSASLAAGLGGFSWIDLDTPWFMDCPELQGGVTRRGATLALDPKALGHGVRVVWPPPTSDSGSEVSA